jgi:hypothetical protein
LAGPLVCGLDPLPQAGKELIQLPPNFVKLEGLRHEPEFLRKLVLFTDQVKSFGSNGASSDI